MEFVQEKSDDEIRDYLDGLSDNVSTKKKVVNQQRREKYLSQYAGILEGLRQTLSDYVFGDPDDDDIDEMHTVKRCDSSAQCDTYEVKLNVKASKSKHGQDLLEAVKLRITDFKAWEVIQEEIMETSYPRINLLCIHPQANWFFNELGAYAFGRHMKLWMLEDFLVEVRFVIPWSEEQKKANEPVMRFAPEGIYVTRRGNIKNDD